MWESSALVVDTARPAATQAWWTPYLEVMKGSCDVPWSPEITTVCSKKCPVLEMRESGGIVARVRKQGDHVRYSKGEWKLVDAKYLLYVQVMLLCDS